MADILPPEGRSRLMAKVRGRGNQSTELVMVRLFREARLTGWRRHLPLPGRPDFCFVRPRVVVFVDGCFWHGCPKCYRRPKTNKKFWDTKRETNRARDRKVNRELRRLGWSVIRIFEHELKNPRTTLVRIKKALGLTGPGLPLA